MEHVKQEKAPIGIRLDPWARSVRKRVTTHPKFYLFDTGITNALQKRISAELDSVHRGRLFEQFIILETLRMASYASSEAEFFYWRTSHGAEVDLLIVRYGKIQAAIEIKSSQSIVSADASGLRAFSEEYPDVDKFIVGTTPNAFTIGDITVLPWMEYINRLHMWV